MLSRGQLAVRKAAREELIVFAYQIWKPQFLPVVQSPFDNCHSPFSPTKFLEIGVWISWDGECSSENACMPVFFMRFRVQVKR